MILHGARFFAVVLAALSTAATAPFAQELPLGVRSTEKFVGEVTLVARGRRGPCPSTCANWCFRPARRSKISDWAGKAFSWSNYGSALSPRKSTATSKCGGRVRSLSFRPSKRSARQRPEIVRQSWRHCFCRALTVDRASKMRAFGA